MLATKTQINLTIHFQIELWLNTKHILSFVLNAAASLQELRADSIMLIDLNSCSLASRMISVKDNIDKMFVNDA